MGGKSEAPPPPDYASAAKVTAAGDLESAKVATAANRVNQVTPYGSLTYTNPNPQDNYSPWTATTSLSPQQQDTLNQNFQLNNEYSNLAQSGVNAIKPLLANPGIDSNSYMQMPQHPGQTSQDVIMSRLAPQIQRESQALDVQLANQGVMPGSEAWKTAKDQQAFAHNDMLTQAAGQGVGMDMNASNQSLQQQAFLTNQPLNIVNAMRTGAQVENPQFQQVPMQSTTKGPDMLGAANAQYNAQLGQYNAGQAQESGLFGGLAGMGMAAAGMPVAGGGSIGGNYLSKLFR